MTLQSRRLALMIHLPGLRLASWNRMIGSSKARHQAAAKRAAYAAVARLDAARLHHIPGTVSVHCIQAVTAMDEGGDWDTPNLCDKYLIDALVERGVLDGDNRRVIRLTSQEWAHGDTVGVRVTIVPSRGRVPQIVINPRLSHLQGSL